MLRLKGIKKDYIVGDQTISALKGVDLAFRHNEFVSILGPSGCGKTTLLNIIGGLDRYSDGDMSINSISTSKYTDADWDAYRNHSVGFVFQNYNLIPHQTVLSNVELALTLSGVSKAERRERAIKALERVGLGDQLNKKPNQMSGGQMQRVAIARALVNDPEILLADEPTGALDTETSVQVMDLMKEIAQDRLVIMVTHNPDLAQQYSTRIIKLLDGKVTDDSNPYNPDNAPARQYEKRRTSMKFTTALSLSLNNLMTKKARTILTAFAGSIGIIGIALILSLSNGISNYISRVEEDTLSSYPLTIQQQTVDMSGMMIAMMGQSPEDDTREADRVYSINVMGEMFNSMLSQVTINDTASFIEYMQSDESGVAELVNDIQCAYPTQMYVYGTDINGNNLQVNPTTMFESVGMGGEVGSMMSTVSSMSAMSGNSSMSTWTQLIDNKDLLSSQYDVVAGRMPKNYNELVLIIGENNTIDDFTLYSLGLKDQSELSGILSAAMTGEAMPTDETSYSYDELMDLEFTLVLNSDFYKEQDGVWVDMRGDSAYMDSVIDASEKLEIVGILRPNEEAVNASIGGSIGYTSDLTKFLIDGINESEIVAAQKADPDTDVFTGLPFTAPEESANASQPGMGNMTEAQINYFASLTPEEQAAIMATFQTEQVVVSTSTYETNLTALGVADSGTPGSISIYPKDFESKEKLTAIIDEYNERMLAEGKEDSVIQYTDYVEILMSSVNTIINAISYVLIAFVAVSLVVSSIMIGIITYISVLERTKEIGILRAMGASKKDIARVFNAETLIVGFVAGALGIGISAALTIPINILIKHLANISGVAALPVAGAVILVIISMVLTFIAGLIPSKIASRKDPVVALRTE
ncbi:MAG: ABC transporter ATP-binding protein/permease [Clostridia bacterium]|nr:ABC transporter ATP-binding protein/permease [Clostridia bacterium]